MQMTKQTGVLLINLGTPDDPSVGSVRKFLRQFLSDPHVIDLPWLVRFLLLTLVILPFRPKKTAKLYQKIWTESGSPLLKYGRQLCEKLAETLGSTYKVALGMRYGNPSLKLAYEQLKGCEKIIVIPLFPQFSQAATGTAIKAAKDVMLRSANTHEVSVVRSFYDDARYIKALAANVQQAQFTFQPDFILFSYHGLPERALKNACEKQCDRVNSCLAQQANLTDCYRAQCFATTHAVVSALHLNASDVATCFQSRLGRAKWIEPYTEFQLEKLIQRGVKRLMVCCPSFVADCLETLEEVNLRLREQWFALGGEDFHLVPCLNASPEWVQALALILTSSQAS